MIKAKNTLKKWKNNEYRSFVAEPSFEIVEPENIASSFLAESILIDKKCIAVFNCGSNRRIDVRGCRLYDKRELNYGTRTKTNGTAFGDS